jgi:hypothetical protein
VGARHGDFEDALRATLTQDVGEIGVGALVAAQQGRGVGALGGRPRRARQQCGRFAQGGGRQHSQARDKGGFAGVGRGHEKRAKAAAMGALGHCQYAGNRAHGAVEAELADGRRPIENAAALPGGAEQREGDGQVERWTLFAHIGRSQVDRDAPRGKFVVGIDDRGTHALAAFLHGGVGQADDGKGRRRRHDVGFDRDRVTVEARQGFARHPGQHARSDPAVEGRPQVAHAGRSLDGVDGDDVETHVGDTGKSAGMAAQPERGEPGDLAALAERDGVFGGAAGAGAARLDFDERKDCPATGDDVDLAAAHALVDRDDAVSLLLKVDGREALGRPAEVVRI